MRRVPFLVLLALAVVLTSAAVVGGYALRGDDRPVAVSAALPPALTIADGVTPVAVDGPDVRAQAARDRRPGRAAPARSVAGGRPAPAPLRRLPAYRVHRAAAPIAPRPVKPPEPEVVPGAPFTFQIGSLNVQGSQHRPNGTGRAAMHADMILGRGVDLVGFQEVQDDQLAVLNNRLPGWTIWPGRSLGNQGVRLQIGWRDDLFELAGTGSIITTFDHQRRPVPWVLLRERATGGEFYVIDLHNSPRDQEADRDSATVAEIALVRQLQATGRPVLLVGDTNEKTEFGCKVSAATGMVGSNGATPSSCVGAGPIKIDKIMGTGGMVSFSGHVVDYAPPVRAATDHAFIRATVTVTPQTVTED